MSYASPDGRVGLSAMLQRIARELAAARDHLHHIEVALDQVSAHASLAQAGPDGINQLQTTAHISRLQSIDLVMQLLAELSGILDRLSHDPAMIQVGEVDVREVLRGLRLADLQRRLGNAVGTTVIGSQVELF